MESPAFFAKMYDETLALLVEARNYVAYGELKAQREPKARQRDGAGGGLHASCEALRVTARLTQVMAWLMIHRAAGEGEIAPEEALADHNRLSGGDVCLDGRSTADETLPAGLRSLLDRSHRLYLRVGRLEAQMLDGVSRVARSLPG
ncbi:MAG: DUF1465 family protein [Magnetospirillum sp.]|nr:DUF1465 family protein [Magnetospirillum sp.]